MSSDPDDVRAQTAEGWRAAHSRRTFLRRGTVTAAAVGLAGSVPGLSGLIAGTASDAPEVESGVTDAEGGASATSLSQPLVAHVKDVGSGEISLFQGDQELVVHDPALARSLSSALRP